MGNLQQRDGSSVFPGDVQARRVVDLERVFSRPTANRVYVGGSGVLDILVGGSDLSIVRWLYRATAMSNHNAQSIDELYSNTKNIINYGIMVRNSNYTTPIIAGTYIFFYFVILYTFGTLKHVFYTMIMEKLKY